MLDINLIRKEGKFVEEKLYLKKAGSLIVVKF